MTDSQQLLYLLILLGIMGGSALFRYYRNPQPVMGKILAWVGIFSVIITGYAYRDVILESRVAGELMPQRPQTQDDGAVTVRKAEDGHFYVRAHVNGQPILFMVDTGATSVMLTREDAERLGFTDQNLRFDQVFNTANGVVYGAAVRLETLAIGPIVMKDVRGSVNKGVMDTSLLGMEFLKGLKGYHVQGDRLSLYP